MSSKSRTLRRRIVIALTVLLVLGAIGVFALRAIESHLDNWFEAADYPALYEQGRWGRYGLPATLPSEATDVVIYATAVGFNIMPVPDQCVEVRFVLPPAQAAVLLTTAKASAPSTAPHGNYATILDRSITVDDRNPGTPVPPSFQHILQQSPSGMNVGGVSINPDTGEVVYWIREH